MASPEQRLVIGEFTGWRPLRVFWANGHPMVDWIYLGERRFDEPFFEDTIQELLYHPFHCAFRRETPMEVLEHWAAESPGIRPAGFIFHMSRCGSTLLARLLGSIRRNVVLSECSPLDGVLRGRPFDASIGEEDRVTWLRWMVSALAQRERDTVRHTGGEQLFIKFDCWNIAQLPLVRRAFPSVPWIFLYRDPLEVLLSHLHVPAGWTIAGEFSSLLLGLDPAEAGMLARDEYCARLLARVCELAVLQIEDGQGRAVSYRDLAGFADKGSACAFGLEFSADEKEAISRTAMENSKVPGQPFAAYSSAKYELCNDRIRALSSGVIAPVINKLERLNASRI